MYEAGWPRKGRELTLASGTLRPSASKSRCRLRRVFRGLEPLRACRGVGSEQPAGTGHCSFVLPRGAGGFVRGEARGSPQSHSGGISVGHHGGHVSAPRPGPLHGPSRPLPLRHEAGSPDAAQLRPVAAALSSAVAPSHVWLLPTSDVARCNQDGPHEMLTRFHRLSTENGVKYFINNSISITC